MPPRSLILKIVWLAQNNFLVLFFFILYFIFLFFPCQFHRIQITPWCLILFFFCFFTVWWVLCCSLVSIVDGIRCWMFILYFCKVCCYNSGVKELFPPEEFHWKLVLIVTFQKLISFIRSMCIGIYIYKCTCVYEFFCTRSDKRLT